MDGAAYGTEQHSQHTNRRAPSSGRAPPGCPSQCRLAGHQFAEACALDQDGETRARLMITLIAACIGIATLLSFYSGVRETAAQRR